MGTRQTATIMEAVKDTAIVVPTNRQGSRFADVAVIGEGGRLFA